MSANLSPTEIDFLLIGAIAGFLCGLAIIGLAQLIDRDVTDDEPVRCDRCHKIIPGDYESSMCQKCWDDVAPHASGRRQ